MNDNIKQKHVLVVGGGIGGITAGLELASCGVKITMLEEGPSIGGRMIQLDKTFPTLDCSTCTLSPKMVEVALNQNIELLSWTKPVAVKRKGAGFTVTVLKKARYVNMDKCTACNACSEGCPVVMKSEFNMGTGMRKAIYIPFPQAIPNKATIDKREEPLCDSPCKDACPVNTNVPGYIRHIRDGRFDDAYRLIRETNPFPSVCGRVCYAPCENECNRGLIDDPLAIRHLKRFAVESFDIDKLETRHAEKTGKRVAIIGAGPAGLSCGHDCAAEGHDVIVFEAMPEPGGMLRYGIPEYRLPKSVLKKEIEYIKKIGVEIQCGVKAGKDIRLNALQSDYDAVFIATGASRSLALGIEGEDIAGVVDGLEFLRLVNSGDPAAVGKNTAVIGGGNTAIDCARTAKRIAGGNVKLIYRRTIDEMPAAREEIDAMLNEGIEIEFLTAPVRFLADKSGIASIECIRMEPGEPDETGRRRPVEIRGSEFIIPADTVITAIGQAADTGFTENIGLSINKNNFIEADPVTGATSIKGIFAGGDVVTGAAYVIDSVAAGKKAALSINMYLKGEYPPVGTAKKVHRKLSEAEAASLSMKIERAGRVPQSEEVPSGILNNFRETSQCYTAQQAISEASRCLAGVIEGCIQCGECERRCEAKAIDYSMKDEIVDMDFDGIVLAPGFDLYDPTEKREYGYGIQEGVMTAMEFERLSSVTGPTLGEILLKEKVPKRFYFIQCVGSRDRQTGARFCSRVCCMYTAKHASIVRDRIKDAEIFISYIDVRAYGKNYEEFYKSTQENDITYIRGIPGEVIKTENGLLVRVEDIFSGEIREIEADMVILATGVRPRKETKELCCIMSIESDENGFIKTDSINPSKTNEDGIFVCGMASGPKDVPDTVASGGEAAASCIEYIYTIG